MQLITIAVLTATAAAYKMGNAVDPPAKEAKMAAVKQVVVMLEDLKAQALKEGEAEVATYNKFSCFCKDTMSEKTAAIEEGENAQDTLKASIGSAAETRTGLDTKITGLVEDIEGIEKDIVDLKTQRKKEVKEYQANEADLSGAVQALEGAIKSLKASKTPSLAQWQSVAKTVRLATVMADALGLGSNSMSGAAFLLQESPDVPTEAYSFKSDSIITTLEKLLVDFKKKRNDVDEAEVTAASTYDKLLQDKENTIDTKNREIDTAKKEKAKTQEEIASDSQDLSVVSANLLSDKEYVTELSKMCSNKAKTWDARSQTRADELSALTTAIGIIKDTVSEKTSGATIRFAQRAVSVKRAEAVVKNAGSMEALEAEAEAADAAPVAFLQRRSLQRHKGDAAPQDTDGRKAVINLLLGEGRHLKSAMLTSLASQVAEDPFAKVKTLITELIERLLRQASDEATQKGWCDKSMSAAAQKRDFAEEEIRELNIGLAENEARRDKLAEEVTVLVTEIAALTKEQSDADAQRSEEKKENAATVTEAKAGQEAVAKAIDILDKFYKTAAKSKVDLSLVQRGPAAVDAPDTGFEAGEAYTGAGGEGGVLGLLDVIHSDFVRTVTETEQAEKQAKQDHLEFTKKTQSSLAEKTTAKTEKTTQRDDTELKLTEAGDNLKSQTDLINGAIEELITLKKQCIDTAMSYEDRVSRRDEEIAALKKADCILTSYAQYGPDAAVSADC